jgi:peptidyl-prolyl cis-trans isomerase C
MPRLLSISALTLAVTLLPAAALAQGKPAAKVNGVSIPQYRLDHAVQSRISQGVPDSPQLRQGVRDALISQEVVAQQAVRDGLDKQPAVAARLELDRLSALAQAYFVEFLRKHPITDDELRKEYERLKPQLATKEYRARHILVNTEDEAKDIIKQLKGGGNFEKLAAEKSKDPGSKGRGGDLDWSPASRYVKPFGDALVTLKKGQITDTPVKTDFGFHVIRLDDERIARLPTFEETKPTLERNRQSEMVQKEIANLRAKAKIE